jgi:hypothetical protein
MHSLPRTAFVAALLALALAAPAHAAFTSSAITTPTTTAFAFRAAGTETITVAGTVSGGSGAADIRCYAANGSTLVAANVGTPGGRFTRTFVPPPIAPPDNQCTLRAVNAGTFPTAVGSFAGPRLALSGFRRDVLESEGPNGGVAYGHELRSALSAGSGTVRGIDACGIVSAGLLDPQTLVHGGSSALCVGSLAHSDDPAGGARSDLRVDDENHYLPAHATGGAMFSGAHRVPGGPALVSTPVAPAADGSSIGVDETAGTVRCASEAFPPTAQTCGSYRPGLVTVARSTRITDGGRTWTVTDRFTSADGAQHELDALYEARWGETPAFLLPGEETFATRSTGFARDLAAGPGSILVRSSDTTDESSATKIAQTWSGNVERFELYRFKTDTHLRMRGTVPASGALELTWIYNLSRSAAELKRLAAQSRERLRGVPPAATPPPPADAGGAAARPAASPPVVVPRAVAALADRIRPRLSRIALARRRFAKRTTLRWRLSEAARITVRIDRLSGRKRRRVRSISRRAAGGVGRLRLSARRLKPGRYRLTLTAVDAAGNRSAPKSIAFRIVL